MDFSARTSSSWHFLVRGLGVQGLGLEGKIEHAASGQVQQHASPTLPNCIRVSVRQTAKFGGNRHCPRFTLRASSRSILVRKIAEIGRYRHRPRVTLLPREGRRPLQFTGDVATILEQCAVSVVNHPPETRHAAGPFSIQPGKVHSEQKQGKVHSVQKQGKVHSVQKLGKVHSARQPPRCPDRQTTNLIKRQPKKPPRASKRGKTHKKQLAIDCGESVPQTVRQVLRPPMLVVV